MTKSFQSRHEAARFVDDWLRLSPADSVLTMIITPEKYEDFSVLIVTDASSADTVVNSEQLSFSFEPPST